MAPGASDVPRRVSHQLSPLPRTPLHAAAFADNVHGLQLLLRHQAEVDTTDKLGRTPLMMASENGHSAALGAWPRSNRPVPSPGPLEPGCPLLCPHSWAPCCCPSPAALPPPFRVPAVPSESKYNCAGRQQEHGSSPGLQQGREQRSPSPCHLSERGCT